jgi:hypothetical protein
MSIPLSPRFQFTIDPKTPLKELLPVAPKAAPPGGPLMTDDLTRVPEVSFQQAPPKGLHPQEALKRNAHTIAKINHLNRDKSDAFMEALLSKRDDLAGLPFAMGDACRLDGERSRAFKQALDTVRQALGGTAPLAKGPPPGHTSTVRTATSLLESIPGGNTAGFWERYQTTCLLEDRENARQGAKHCEHVTHARIAALMQVLAPESAAMRKGLVKYLAGVSHPEATKALAKLTIFSAEEEVRAAAIDALKVRRERDYTDLLLRGLRYPYAPVARRASDALVKLERTDLLEKLVDLLEAPDPRLPVTETVRGKRVPVVRELVRINHHRNCLLCHSPGNTPGITPETVTAAVPTPGESMNPPSSGYQQSPSPDVLVRVDVTYLRQDFSVLQPVADAHPWPAMQRFDFVVRRRVLSEQEAEVYREKLTPRERGRLSPYHRAVLATLRELTGRDAAPTPQAWRELLNLARKQESQSATP